MLSQSLVKKKKKKKKKKKAVTVFTPPLLKLVICCVTYWRKNDKIPRSRLKYHHRLAHYSGDWQLQLPSQQDDRAVFDRSLSSCDDTVWCDETGVTASAIYDWDCFFFLQQNLFWCFSCCTQSCYCIALKTVISSGPFFYPQFFFIFFIFFYSWI